MAMSKGCTIALIAVGVLVLILLAGGIYICSNPEKLIGVVIDQLEKEIVLNLPEGETAESVHQLMAEFKVAFKDGRVTPGAMQQLSADFQTAYADKKLDPAESGDLLNSIRTILGYQPAAVDSLAVPPIPDTTAVPVDSMR